MVYLPEHFATDDQAQLSALVAAHPLATLVTHGRAGIAVNHIPLLLLPASASEGHVLVGHVARANDLWREGFHDRETIAVFQGPDAYISPNWYPTKQRTHEVVPTWNYAVAHAHGRLVVHDDPKWVRGVVARLTQAMEATMPRPWKVGDAPPAFVERSISNIVGIELMVDRWVGKVKMGQNKPDEDRLAAADALEGTGSAAAGAVAALMKAPPAR